ncbi:hypothetical protein CEXT_356821 [Caerostris extrusa]|uniref:Uncharacterized protein n=1 Tax=Caerostris extrusa TaxID=172846 RepID=A0AAV4Y8S8_CAEEX|nr:hypothetical protein CEXT_356821 [Caerostris extrusa]
MWAALTGHLSSSCRPSWSMSSASTGTSGTGELRIRVHIGGQAHVGRPFNFPHPLLGLLQVSDNTAIPFIDGYYSIIDCLLCNKTQILSPVSLLTDQR